MCSLSDIVNEAEKKCKDGRIFNLFLQKEFHIDEIDSAFIKSFIKKATEWQSPDRPESLIINHGEYIYKYGDAIKHIIDELKRKPDSNRALYSLISSKEILNSNDNPIPSFLILQFGFKDYQTIVCTAYFRALEVSKFLPINLAEICLILRRIKKNFPQIVRVNLTIHSFSAYSNKDFYCLEVSDLDLNKNKGRIAIAIYTKDYNTIIRLLRSKIRDESYINLNGMIELVNALEQCRHEHSELLISKVKSCIEAMKKLQFYRKSSSHSDEISVLSNKIKSDLEEIIKLFTKLLGS